ncbi:MAG TPA: Pycsar system effector family protein [Rhodothermales bacterium]|nr:Pycsar system effector family protein [Rhodothermales bacterium]
MTDPHGGIKDRFAEKGDADIEPNELDDEQEDLDDDEEISLGLVGPAQPNDVTEKKKKKKKDKEEKKSTTGSTLGTTRGVETLFRTSYMVNMNLSSLADAKSNIMISINGIIISIILGSISAKIDTNPWLIIPTVILLIGCLASMVYAVLAARPRVSSKFITLDEVRASKANILFFGNFARLTEDEFIVGMTDLLRNTDLVYVNMMRDTYGLGLVLLKKYRLLRYSYSIFMVALIVGVAAFVTILVLVAGGMITSAVP